MDTTRFANIKAEANILGAVLVKNNKILDVIDVLEPQDFYDGKNRSIYAAMVLLYKHNTKIDITTLAEVLKEKKDVTISYISELVADSPIGGIKDYCRIVKEKSKMRVLRKIIQTTANEIEDGREKSSTILEKLENQLTATAEEKDTLLTDADLMDKTLDMIQENYQKGGAILGLKTGMKTLDEIINGLQKKRFYVIAGRPGMAKSSFALNIAQTVARDKNVLFYSLEMGAEELGIRRLAMRSFIDTMKLEKGIMTEDEWKKMSNISSTISRGYCYTDCTPNRGINTIRLQCKKLKMQNKLDLLIVDYIGIMSLRDMGDSRQEQISNVCIELKNMSKEFDIPVIALAQINRGPEARNDKRPMLSDLKESGGIEENADVVMLLYRDEYYHKNTKEKNVIEVNIAKQRGGRTGTIKLAWQPKYQLITDRAMYQEDGTYDPKIFKNENGII